MTMNKSNINDSDNMVDITNNTDDMCITTTRVVSLPSPDSPHHQQEIMADCYAMPIAMPISTDTTSKAPTMTSTTMSIANESSSITGKRSDIWKKYHISTTVLGKGHFATVRTCTDRTTGQRYAVKSISKTDSSVKPAAISREINLLQEMKHESIVQLVDVFEDAEYVHIVTNLCHGGELFDKVLEKTADDNGVPCFDEHEAAKIILQILNAVSYMHDHFIVHRDIKPENILFDSKDADSPIKIIDMGLARKHDIESPMTTIVGTPYYIAPEVLKKKYDKSCDLWSVGVIAYILLSGYPPFNGRNTDQTHKLIVQGRYSFPSRDWKYNSDESIDFIRRLLTYDPEKRMTVEEALNHPWIVRYATNQDTVIKDTQGKSFADNTVVPVKGLSKPRSLLLCGSRRKKNTQKKIRKSMFGIAA